MNLRSLIGIDYGALKSGNTSIAHYDGRKISFYKSERNKSSDNFILDFVENNKEISKIFMDAPLSIPGVYKNLPNKNDYFYRDADRELQAMSPMFLGGLTARAMKLKKFLENQSINVYEVYPKAVANAMGLIDYKKMQKAEVIYSVSEKIQESIIVDETENDHELDSLLAWFSGYRYLKGNATLFGDKEEGQIIV